MTKYIELNENQKNKLIELKYVKPDEDVNAVWTLCVVPDDWSWRNNLKIGKRLYCMNFFRDDGISIDELLAIK